MKNTQKQGHIDFNIKQEENKYPELEGKLELVLKLMNVIINLSIAESQKIEKKSEIIQFYNNEFKKEENNIYLSFKKFVFANLINSLLEIKLDTAFAYSIFEPLTKFINNEINIDSLLEILITVLQNGIKLVKKNGSKNISIKIIDDFYYYLNGHIEKIINAKRTTSSIKSKEEEKNIKNNYQESYAKKISDLQEQLKKTENELEIESKKEIQLSLDNNSYKENNNKLLDKIKLVENEKKSTISKKEETIKQLQSQNEKNSLEYKKTIERIEAIIKINNEEKKMK